MSGGSLFAPWNMDWGRWCSSSRLPPCTAASSSASRRTCAQQRCRTLNLPYETYPSVTIGMSKCGQCRSTTVRPRDLWTWTDMPYSPMNTHAYPLRLPIRTGASSAIRNLASRSLRLMYAARGANFCPVAAAGAAIMGVFETDSMPYMRSMSAIAERLSVKKNM